MNKVPSVRKKRCCSQCQGEIFSQYFFPDPLGRPLCEHCFDFNFQRRTQTGFFSAPTQRSPSLVQARISFAWVPFVLPALLALVGAALGGLIFWFFV